MKREQKEDKQINIPVSKYFERVLKCQFSKPEFKFKAGELDVLGYNREKKCFHICEGKRSKNIASLGHAIGQLVAYMTMIYEDGYDFLDRVTRGERLEASDFSSFFEKKSIKVCFYIGLPIEHRDKLLAPAQLMLKKLGVFGESIGILFASKKRCEAVVPATSMEIPIQKLYNREDFIDTVRGRISEFAELKGLQYLEHDKRQYVLQFKKKNGHPGLHYEVWFKRHKKTDANYIIELAFHLEIQLNKKNYAYRLYRSNKVKNAMKKSMKKLKKHDFKFAKFGKNWFKIYNNHITLSNILNDNDMNYVISQMKCLIDKSKPFFDKAKWGMKNDKKSDEVEL